MAVRFEISKREEVQLQLANGEVITMNVAVGSTDAEIESMFRLRQQGMQILEGDRFGAALMTGLTEVGVGAAVSRLPIIGRKGGAVIEAGLQGIIAAAFEASRQASTGDQSIEDIIRATTFSAVVPPAVRGAGRFASGFANLGRPRRAAVLGGKKPAIFPQESVGGFSQNVARFTRSAGALNRGARGNQGLVNISAARAAGVPETLLEEARVNGMTEDLFQASKRTIDEFYELARPDNPVDITAFKAAIQQIIDSDIPEPGLKDIIKMIDAGDPTSIAPEAWQGIQRRARDIRASISSNSVWKAWRDPMDEAITILDQAAIDAGGDPAILGKANSMFKIRAGLRENSQVREIGQVPAGAFGRQLARKGSSGFGPEVWAAGFPEGTDPDLVNLRRTLLDVAAFERNVFGGSPTAGRAAAFGEPIKDVAAAVTDPAAAPGLLFRGAGKLGLVQIAGIASVGLSEDIVSPAIRGGAAQLPSVFNLTMFEEEKRAEERATRLAAE